MNIAKTQCSYLPGFFQIAYVSNNFEQAQKVLGEQFGISRYHNMLDMEFNEKTKIDIAIAYVGDTMIEIITPKGTGEDIYSTHMPAGDDFVIRHHHFGHIYTDLKDWQHMQPLIKKHPIAYQSQMEGYLEVIYTDNRSVLGHYLEYIYATPAGMEFLNQAPQNA